LTAPLVSRNRRFSFSHLAFGGSNTAQRRRSGVTLLHAATLLDRELSPGARHARQMILLPSAAIIREEWKPKSSKFGSGKKQPTQGYEVAAAPCTTFQLAWLGLAAASPTEGGQRCHVDGWVKVCIPSANRFIHQLTHNPSSMRCPQTGPVANLGFHPALWKSLFEQMTAMSLTHSHLISSPICALTPGPEPAPVEPVEQPRHRGGVLPCFAPLSAHGGRHGLL
jgi:hypothetical protein